MSVRQGSRIVSGNTAINKANRNLDNLNDDGYEIIRNVAGNGGSGSSFNLFDTKFADHILTGNEKLGWAMQGTYVEKKAVAGEHYGYPTFYNTCVNEALNENNSTELILNVSLVGSINNANGIVSGFAEATSYVKSTKSFNLSGDFEIRVKFTTPSEFTVGSEGQVGQIIAGETNTYIAHTIEGSEYFGYNVGDGSKWHCNSETNHGSTLVKTNTTYVNKIIRKGNKFYGYISEDLGVTFKEDWYFESDVVIPEFPMLFGCGRNLSVPFGGSIDLTETYVITADDVWSGAGEIFYNSNGHKFYDIGIKNYIDNIFNASGIAEYYGIDTIHERIFLPRNKHFYQLTCNTNEVNKTTEAGLPNIKGVFVPSEPDNGGWAGFGASSNKSIAGAFYLDSVAGRKCLTETSNNWSGGRLCFDASRSSAVYGKSNTVQPTSTAKLLYYCVGNTLTPTGWVDIVTQVKEGVKDIEDVKAEAINDLTTLQNTNLDALSISTDEHLENINNTGKSYTNLTHNNITNCIVSYPENIKCSLINGVLTVYAGTKLVRPWGTIDLSKDFPVGTILNNAYKVIDTEYINSKFYIYLELLKDTSYSDFNASVAKNNCTQILLNGVGGFAWYGNEKITSGTDNTADTSKTYQMYYDTTLNRLLIDSELTGTFSLCEYTFPILNISREAGVCTAINQVYDGCGFFGKSVFVNRGVRALIPNGRNKDFSAINMDYTTKYFSHTLSSTACDDMVIAVTPSGDARGTCYQVDMSTYTHGYKEPSTIRWYDPETNKYYLRKEDTWQHDPQFHVAYFSRTATTINKLSVRKPVQLADLNDHGTKKEIINWLLPDYENAITIYANYVCPDNGYVVGEFTAAHGENYYIYVNGIAVLHQGAETNQRCRSPYFIMVRKGDKITGQIMSAQFIPIRGAK